MNSHNFLLFQDTIKFINNYTHCTNCHKQRLSSKKPYSQCETTPFLKYSSESNWRQTLRSIRRRSNGGWGGGVKGFNHRTPIGLPKTSTKLSILKTKRRETNWLFNNNIRILSADTFFYNIHLYTIFASLFALS